jgi:Flp pilus assembly protein TadG
MHRLLRGPRSRHRSRGQSLAEFALVFPIMMLILGGIIQFGLIFWAQNTLVQVARDTGRWASTQVTCPTDATVTPIANTIAGQSSLFGYSTGSWTAPTNVRVTLSGSPCPVTSNADVAFVTIGLSHRVPIFFPFVPGNGQISTTAQFRMEPNP